MNPWYLISFIARCDIIPMHCQSNYIRLLCHILYNVVVKYYHTIVYSTGKNCIVAINKYKGNFHFIIYFKNAVVFIVSSTAGSSCCSVLCLFRIFAFRQPNSTLFRYSGIVYRSSDMILAAHSDAGFNNETKSRSRSRAHIFISENESIPRWNGPILTIALIMKYVLS